MAAGSQHTKINMFIFWLLMTSIIMMEAKNGQWLLFGYLLSTFWLNPDLDMNNTRPDQNYGYVVHRIWDLHTWVFSHRSRMSHSIYATPIRILYLGAVICVYLAFVNESYLIKIRPFLKSDQFRLLIIGIWLGDIMHLIADEVKDWYNKIRRS